MTTVAPAGRPYTVRRVRAAEWQQVRALRLQALRDPAAPVAFIDDYAEAAARPDAFWQRRATDAAQSTAVAQFVGVLGGDGGAGAGPDAAAGAVEQGAGRWVGSVSVLVQQAGERDDAGRPLRARRGLVVGVYVCPEHRGTGLIRLLLDAAAAWGREQGLPSLALGVHRNNPRARSAYAKAGFAPSGLEFTGPIGPELELVRPL